MRLRQFVFVAEKLQPATEELSTVLGLEICYRDPNVAKFGLENALFAIGGDFLGIVAPAKRDTSAGRYLERQGGNCGYMVILQCSSALTVRSLAKKLGVRSVWCHDRPEAFATHFHPTDVSGAILSVASMPLAISYHDNLAN